jgi:hypothetical protein
LEYESEFTDISFPIEQVSSLDEAIQKNIFETKMDGKKLYEIEDGSKEVSSLKYSFKMFP